MIRFPFLFAKKRESNILNLKGTRKMKLGEALINAGLITVKELQQALERQDILGGRIDTNLVELKFIDDAKLSLFLGKFLNLPVVSSNMVNSIPEDVIDLLSKEKIEKYKLLPFKKEGHKLHVAMLNPKDIKAIDDLRFITGFDIIPYVITEIKLLDAFEKYYGIKKAFRYISMQEGFAPGKDLKDSDIERYESKLDQRKYKEKRTDLSLTDKVKGTLSEFAGHDAEEKAKLIGALLTNSFYTAKLFYLQQGKPLTDNDIEDQVIQNWARISRRMISLKKKTSE